MTISIKSTWNNRFVQRSWVARSLPDECDRCGSKLVKKHEDTGLIRCQACMRWWKDCRRSAM